MKKNNVAFLLLIFLIVAFSFFYANQKFQLGQDLKTVFSPYQSSTSQGLAAENSKKQSNSSSADLAISNQVNSEFKNWIQAESTNLENSVTNAELKKQELLKISTTLKNEERTYLVSKILSLNTSANDKIFASYLLGLDVDHNLSGLWQILAAPLNFEGTQTPHSPEETLALQEKTLRRMSIDAIIDYLKIHPEKKSEFNSQFQSISDPSLRDYAMKRLREIP